MPLTEEAAANIDAVSGGVSSGVTPMEVDNEVSIPMASEPVPTPSTSVAASVNNLTLNSNEPLNKELQCYPQRAALLKSMLNFLKKAIQDPAFSDSIRHCK